MDFSGLKSTSDLDKYTDFIVTAISTTVNKAIPKSKSERSESNPISDETIALIKEKRRLRRQYSQNKDPAIKTHINQLQKQVKDKLKVETQATWEKFCSSVSLETDPSESWCKVKNFLKPNRQLDYPTLRHDHKVAKTNADKAQLFAESVERHFGIESEHFDSNHFNEVNQFKEDNHGYFYPPEDSDNYRFDVGNEHELVEDVFADDTAQWAFSLNVRFAAKRLQQDLINLAMWCVKWRIKLNPEKTNVIIFSRSKLARKTEPNLKLYGETLKVYHQVKFLGITFDSQLTFQKYVENILDRRNTSCHQLRLLANKKWGPSPSTIIQIYKQCVQTIFKYGSLSTITISDNIISKIQRLQNNFIRLALRLPEDICPKLLHDSAGLPYVKNRLLSCATKSPSSNILNLAWDRFPTSLSVVRPVSLYFNAICWGDLP